MKFHESHTGMFGIWSDVSKQFVFGIQEPSKTKAWKSLYKKIDNDARKWRWRVKPIRQRDAHMFKQDLKFREVD
ncbi:hypothetical protein [Heyndrickxia sporothermodurans]|uniref:hypothetical protein n=1 Tax=Heyndrickxia sporothermodurans TaxID=46224 RepID=UPI002E2217FC|nr:hypothetical protein [Heyndrickxia sporothermodurans]MED3697397.1 hypothetical protein [Heyndrickxia sporothermodurans]